MKLNKFVNKSSWDLLIISMRFLLAFVFFSYAISKFTGNQFGGLTAEELNTPLKDLSLFKIAWYLFEHEPFNFFTGICEALAALLLLFRRTTIPGTLMLIPIIANILVIDIMIMPPLLKIGFIFRLSFYLIFCGFILHSYKEDLQKIWKIITAGKNVIKHKYWKLLLVPLIMLSLELPGFLFKILYFLIVFPGPTIEYLKNLF